MLDYLTHLFDKQHSYSSLNTARSALSSLGIKLESYTAGTHPLVVRFLKGVYNIRPPIPRYSKIWDVDIVLRYLQKLSPVRHLSLKDLTLKLVMLMALTNAARIHTINMLSVTGLLKLKSEFVLKLDGLVKQSQPGKQFNALHFKAYPPDRRLCVYFVMKEYLKRTKIIRSDTESKLLLSYVKPHNAVSKDTVARWVKTVMARSGIDTNVFKPHSVRSAATSKASAKDVPIDEIMRTAGWSSAGTFQKFYNKPIQKDAGFSASVVQL